MLRFDAHSYVRLVTLITQFEDEIKKPDEAGRNATLFRKAFVVSGQKSYEEVLREVGDELEALALPCSAAQIVRIIDAVNLDATVAECAELFKELRQRITDELKLRTFYFVPPDRAQYFEKHGFDALVTNAFPSATLDIEEAGKCFAVGRWTACVFHLMRVTEHGVRELARFLKAPSDFKTWDPIIKKMRAAVDDYTTSEFKGDLDFIRQTLERLTGVQTALRNEVMHSRSFYDEERALDVYRAVRAFMQQLAMKLAESNSEAS